MSIKIDREACIGCGLCVQIAIGVFEMDGDKAVVVKNDVEENLLNDTNNAVEQCPVNAIITE